MLAANIQKLSVDNAAPMVSLNLIAVRVLLRPFTHPAACGRDASAWQRSRAGPSAMVREIPHVAIDDQRGPTKRDTRPNDLSIAPSHFSAQRGSKLGLSIGQNGSRAVGQRQMQRTAQAGVTVMQSTRHPLAQPIQTRGTPAPCGVQDQPDIPRPRQLHPAHDQPQFGRQRNGLQSILHAPGQIRQGRAARQAARPRIMTTPQIYPSHYCHVPARWRQKAEGGRTGETSQHRAQPVQRSNDRRIAAQWRADGNAGIGAGHPVWAKLGGADRIDEAHHSG